MPAGQGELQHLAVIERALEFRMGSMGSSSRTMLMISGYSCWQDVDRRICLADDATVQVSHYAVACPGRYSHKVLRAALGKHAARA